LEIDALRIKATPLRNDAHREQNISRPTKHPQLHFNGSVHVIRHRHGQRPAKLGEMCQYMSVTARPAGDCDVAMCAGQCELWVRCGGRHSVNRPTYSIPRRVSELCHPILIKKSKIPRPLSQAAVSNHFNVFTFTLPLSEGRTSEAWEPPNKTIPFLPYHSQVPLTSPMSFHFHLPFYHSETLQGHKNKPPPEYWSVAVA
jgi:hypothetical protein